MKSRTSFFNGTLIKKDLLRGAPLWGGYLLIWLVGLPLYLLSSDYLYGAQLDMQQYILGCAVTVSHIAPYLYGAAAAWLVFSYLCRSRSANFFASLPLTRTNLFFTKYLTGLLYGMGPHLIVAVLTGLVVVTVAPVLLLDVLQWFLTATLGYVFYYSFAVLCFMVVGHIVAMPALYTVLNFTAVVLESIIRELLSAFVYGMYFSGEIASLPFSPLVAQLTEHGLEVDVVWNEAMPSYNNYDAILRYELNNWAYLLILAAVGVLFTAVAYGIYRKRRMEAAGDVIAVRHLKPVFLYCFTFGSSLTIGLMLAAMLVPGFTTGNFLSILLCLLTGAVLGFFAGQMMLQKSLRVFRKGNWLRCGISCCVIVVLMLGFKFDLFGVASYVPEPDHVTAVSFGFDGVEYEDPDFIRRVIAFHQDLIDQQEETEVRNEYADRVTTLRVTYYLDSGSSVIRRYAIPVDAETANNPNSLIRRYEVLVNDPDYIVARELPEEPTRENLARGYLYLNVKDGSEEVYLSGSQVYELLQNGIIPDMRAGRIGGLTYTDRYGVIDHEVTTPEPAPVKFNGADLQIEYRSGKTQYIGIWYDARQTIETLTEMGLVDASYFESGE